MTEDVKKDKQKKDGLLIWAILVAFGVGALMSFVFAVLMYGLWVLPVTELVEQSPVNLYDSLQLVVVVLAILVSYQLISFKENKKVWKEDMNKSLQNSRNTELKARPARPATPTSATPATSATLARRRSST